MATGLLWAPCAGPILGLVLTGAALSGPTARTTLLLFAYAAGAATSLAIAILAGRKGVRRAQELSRAPASGSGADSASRCCSPSSASPSGGTSASSRGSPRAAPIAGSCLCSWAPASAVERHPARRGHGELRSDDDFTRRAAGLADRGDLPSLAGATGWLNSPPLTHESLRGKVVLIDFWTYSCINCLRALPYVKRWYDTYRDHGLVVIGVHAPEFAFERDPDNVRRAVPSSGSAIRWRSTTTTPYGAGSTTNIGPRTTSSTPRAVYERIISARATTQGRSTSSASS